MRQKSILAKVILIAIGVAWVWITRVPSGQGIDPNIQAPQAGFMAPDFSLETLSGTSAGISDLRGKAVILNFWASWCPPCRAEMPAFQQTVDEFAGTDLVVLGVNATSQDSLGDVRKFLDKYQLSFAIPLDINGQVSRTYQVRSLPTTFFIDRKGVIKKVMIGGPIPLSLLRVEASQLLQGTENDPDY